MKGLGHGAITPGPGVAGFLKIDFPALNTLPELERALSFFDEITEVWRKLLDEQVRVEITRVNSEIKPWLAGEIHRRWQVASQGVNVDDEFPNLVASQLIQITHERGELVRLLDAIFAKVVRFEPSIEYTEGYHSHSQAIESPAELVLDKAFTLVRNLNALRQVLTKA